MHILIEMQQEPMSRSGARLMHNDRVFAVIDETDPPAIVDISPLVRRYEVRATAGDVKMLVLETFAFRIADAPCLRSAVPAEPAA